MSEQQNSFIRPDGSPARILIVDDEAMLTDLLAMAVKMEGWDAVTADGGMSALTAAKQHDPDVIVLDVMMPDLDGFGVLQRLRESGNNVPVLFLTAKDAVSDRIIGLDSGADDYVTKPFSIEEVVSRLRNLMRRSGTQNESEDPVLRVGDLVLNENSHEVRRGDDNIDLTATEFELLRYMMENPRRVLSKATLLDNVWVNDFEGRSSIVELYISYLRKKIDHGKEPLIHTIRGVGYMLRSPQDSL